MRAYTADHVVAVIRVPKPGVEEFEVLTCTGEKFEKVESTIVKDPMDAFLVCLDAMAAAVMTPAEFAKYVAQKGIQGAYFRSKLM